MPGLYPPFCLRCALIGFVIITFLVGIFIARVLKIDQKLAILIASGTAICGATAMAAIAPLIKAKPKDLLISLAIIFLEYQ